jgi:hypothetical protein
MEAPVPEIMDTTLRSRHQNAGQNRDVETANISFENFLQYKYLWTTLTNQNFDSGGN